MSEFNSAKRVTCKRPHPNQRLQELLQSLYRKAVAKNSDFAFELKEAISSLEKYPLPITSGAECAILKGFDIRLCKYIDSQLNGYNKKTKVTDHGSSSLEGGGSNRETPVKSDEEMAAASNRNLIINSNKCSLTSKLGEASTSNTMPSVSPTISNNSQANQRNSNLDIDNPTNNEVKLCEKNNNTPTSACSDDACAILKSFDTYFVNKVKQDAVDNNEIQNDGLSAKFSLSENWESFRKKDRLQFKSKYDEEIRKRYQHIQVIVPDADYDSVSNHSVTEINDSSDDEIISQPILQQSECLHSEQLVHCAKCEYINTTADSFQSYYKNKLKKDAEEIEKCILPRKMYKPAYRSGGYAILVALLEQRNECPYRDCLTKEELIQKAQKHTEQSFTKSNSKSNYTAWTNVKRLISKDMIETSNGKSGEDFYKLTAMGITLALELVKEHSPTVMFNDIIFHGQQNDRVPRLEDVVFVPPPPLGSVDEEQDSLFIEMPPGTFDIVMLADKRENFKLPASPNNHVKYESRCLTLGDFLWVARDKKTGQELVLPYIVERKRMDDLASSIKDGRFHEQKFRLRKCGLKNVIYLVENYKHSMRAQHGLPQSTLDQAVINTHIQDNFNIAKTYGLQHTLNVLDAMSESLVHKYLATYLRGCNKDTKGRELMTFEFFNKSSSKNKPLTVKDTFIKMLLQLKGLSIEKALAITNKYGTPRVLIKAYERCTKKEGELMLANLKYNHFTRNVGPAVSKTVYQLFSRDI